MNPLSQIVALTTMSLSSVPRRFGLSLVTVVGIGTVVGVLISFLAMGAGLEQMAISNVRQDRAVVLSSGASSSLTSSLAREAVATIRDAPGIKKDTDGRPLISAGLMVPVGTGLSNNTLIVGTGPAFNAVFPELRVFEGRMIHSGVRELVVGKVAGSPFAGLTVGDRISLRGSEWTIVGRFEQNGGTWENYAVADSETMLSAFERNVFQSVTVVLDSAVTFDSFKEALAANPSISVDVLREGDYVLMGFGNFTRLLSYVGFFIGGVMAVGAACGALNTMYAVIDARRLEIATLRALGFSATSVVYSVLVEALALALIGALAGAFVAWLLFNGLEASTRGITFSLAVTPSLVRLGLAWAIAMGLIGAVLPAIRAARLQIAAALGGK